MDECLMVTKTTSHSTEFILNTKKIIKLEEKL